MTQRPSRWSHCAGWWRPNGRRPRRSCRSSSPSDRSPWTRCAACRPGRPAGGNGTPRTGFATALKEMSGTVLPNAMWNPMSSSTGCGTRPTRAGERRRRRDGEAGGIQGAVHGTIPSVTVRGVACSITWPDLKSSKKLPGFVLLGPKLPGDGRPEACHLPRTTRRQPDDHDRPPHLLEVAPNFRDIAAHAPLARGLAYRSSGSSWDCPPAQSVLRSPGCHHRVRPAHVQVETHPVPGLPARTDPTGDRADVLADAPSSGGTGLPWDQAASRCYRRRQQRDPRRGKAPPGW